MSPKDGMMLVYVPAGEFTMGSDAGDNDEKAAFERAREGKTSYLTRFGFKNALVVLNQNGAETSWQVPDFAIDLEHRDSRSIIVGEANVASTKGDWQLEVRAEQRPKRQSFAITTLIQNLEHNWKAADRPRE